MATEKEQAEALEAVEQVAEEVQPERFTKSAILASDRFGRYRDLLGGLLEDDVVYTADEVEKALKNALNHVVKQAINE